ncbi:hypothetical protein F2Q69_00012559 [Brassica cretica]|uniref:Uncharacterized protein n=1 Tax=Brassica cretica TaxID=69181 RepID=A0A8S9R9A4_BRACR|nr:hypothetical protein F2Q69_00012559 [Brassica cretica]
MSNCCIIVAKPFISSCGAVVDEGFMIPGVLSLTILRVVNQFVWFRIRKEVGIVPHVRVRVVFLVLPSLSSDIAHLLLIVHSVLCVRCDI